MTAAPRDGILGDAEEFGDVDATDWSITDDAAMALVGDATSEVASLVRSTLGPRGMEKLIETHDLKGEREIVLSSDGKEILDAIQRGDGFAHPVAAVFVDCVDSMQRGLHDGTTSSILLTDLLMERGRDLVEDGLHPSNVVLGYAVATTYAGEVLDDLTRHVSAGDTDLLKQVAKTSFPEDLSEERQEAYAEMVVEAVRGLSIHQEGWIDTDDVKVIAETNVPRSFHRGVVVTRVAEKEETIGDYDAPRGEHENYEELYEFDWFSDVPEPIEDATLAVIDDEIEFGETAAPVAHGNATQKIGQISSTAELDSFISERDAHIAATAERLVDMGVDVVAARLDVDDHVKKVFGRAGLTVIDRVDHPERDIDRLGAATGATVVSHLSDLQPGHLGTVGRLEEFRLKEEDEKWAVFDKCAGGVYTIVLDALTETEAARRQRLVEDAMELVAMAIMDGQLLPGAGAPAMAVAAALRDRARSIPSKEQLAVEAFADALEEYVHVLAKNLGFRRGVVYRLRSEHGGAEPVALGIDKDTGEPVDPWERGVVAPRRVFSQTIETARTTTEQLLTIDGVLFPDVDFEEFTPLADWEA